MYMYLFQVLQISVQLDSVLHEPCYFSLNYVKFMVVLEKKRMKDQFQLVHRKK